MNIEINFRDHVPIYVQLMEQIKHQIATGTLKPGDQLPTVRQLAADLRVNFNTVARAYRLLDEDAIISTQHGRGTFILDPLSEKEAVELREKDLNRMTRQYLYSAHRMGFSPKEVRSTFKKKIDMWVENGAPPAPDYEE
jgi:GntR family transcriptional regulator